MLIVESFVRELRDPEPLALAIPWLSAPALAFPLVITARYLSARKIGGVAPWIACAVAFAGYLTLIALRFRA